jgi:p21-activated kinase 1
MEEIKTTSRRLTKKPPPGSPAYANHPAVHSVENRLDNLSLRSQRSSGSLQRAPSAPTYPRYSNSGQARTTNPATYASSSSSLDYQVSAGPSPAIPSSESNAPPVQSAPKRFSNPTRALNEKTSEEFIGAPFDGSGILSHIDSTKASGYQNSLRRPPPPPLSQTSPDPRIMNPPLQQSQSLSLSDKSNEKTPPRVGENQLISPKRYSDETKEPKSAAFPRKKSGFSGFMSGLVGSPRRVNISPPENPVHVTHVGYDNETGQFTVSFHLNLERGYWCLDVTGPATGMATHDYRRRYHKEGTRAKPTDYC